MEADLPRLKSDRFTAVTSEGLDFLRCVHSWKWCWASGKRMMVVGLGVRQRDLSLSPSTLPPSLSLSPLAEEQGVCVGDEGRQSELYVFIGVVSARAAARNSTGGGVGSGAGERGEGYDGHTLTLPFPLW